MHTMLAGASSTWLSSVKLQLNSQLPFFFPAQHILTPAVESWSCASGLVYFLYSSTSSFCTAWSLFAGLTLSPPSTYSFELGISRLPTTTRTRTIVTPTVSQNIRHRCPRHQLSQNETGRQGTVISVYPTHFVLLKIATSSVGRSWVQSIMLMCNFPIAPALCSQRAS